MWEHTRTEGDERLNQEADERQLQSFLKDRQIKAIKLPRIKGAKSADFELSIDSCKIVTELKSRFDDNSYNKLLDYMQRDLSTIRAGYDCSIDLNYRHKMPSLILRNGNQ